jgi:tripartite-type tricarboxylate transporter receptor subunit TctC
VHPSVPANTPQELIAYIKANPGKLSYGSPGLGSSGHLAGEQFKQINNLVIQHVHYRGAAPALQDLVAGHVQVMFDIVPLTKEQLAAGKVRALAITSKQRGAAVPDVPTMVEAGMPEVQGGPWFGLFAPAGTPAPILDRLHAELTRIMGEPGFRQANFIERAVDPVPQTRAEFAKFIIDNRAFAARVAKETGMQPQ